MALGPGAAAWLIEAGAIGARHIEARMADAVSLAKLEPVERVDQALGVAAVAGRFAAGDLESILAAAPPAAPVPPPEAHSLQPGTSAWEALR